MKQCLVAGAFLAAAMGLASHASACPCRASFGPGGALTGSGEQWGVSLSETAQFVHGYWDARGHYASIQGFQRRLDLLGTAAYRAVPVLELSLSSALGSSTMVAPGGFNAASTGFGDTVLRVRWDAHEEPVPHRRSLLNPAVALIASLRAPTATELTTRQSNFGSYSSSLSEGLGAWEGALAIDLSHALRDDWRVGVLFEGALRTGNESLGVDRQLGPRLLAQTTLGHHLVQSLELGALAEIEWEADTSLAGSTVSGTGRRAINLGGFASFVPQDSPVRSGFQLRHSPSIAGLAVNAVATTQIGVSLGYVH